MASSGQIALFTELVCLGCCQRCCLRFIGNLDIHKNFDNPEETLFICGLISESPDVFFSNKEQICSVCLGILQEPFVKEVMSLNKINHALEYDIKNFVIELESPTAVLIRNHSMMLYLEEHFPDIFEKDKCLKITCAWRHAVKDRLSARINKVFKQGAPLNIIFSVAYLYDEKETANMELINPEPYSSKNTVSYTLHNVPDTLFKQYVPTPPEKATQQVCFHNLSFSSDSIYITGCYQKYSRFLLLNPYVVNNETLISFSIQTIICRAIEAVLPFPFERLTWATSGAEDISVRVLGKGRQFYVVVYSPKFAGISRNDLLQIERNINIRPSMAVHSLAVTPKLDAIDAIECEKMGSKSFKALICLRNFTNLDDCVNAINTHTFIDVEQKTVVKQLQYRAVKTLKKKVLFIKAQTVPGKKDWIVVDMTFEFGLYHEEFIHGDLGRTKPSLSSITNSEIDIIGIDIVDFNTHSASCIETEIK